MGASPWCATAHIDTFGEITVLYGFMVPCGKGEVVFKLIDNAVLNILDQCRVGIFRASL